MQSDAIFETDILVIGGGLAGVFAAVKSREQGLDVILVDKGSVGCSGLTPFARGFRWYDEDFLGPKEDFIQGSSIFGEYLNNRNYLKHYCDRSKAAYEDMAKWGIFGHIKYAEALATAVKKSGAQIIKRTMITNLIVEEGRVVGAAGFPMEGNRFIVIKAKAVIMCAGAGAFKPNGFPVSSLTSDGDAMAYRIGAEITGKEFADTHDTVHKNPADCWNYWGAHWSGGMTPAMSELERNLSLDRTFEEYYGIEMPKPVLVKNEVRPTRSFSYRGGQWSPNKDREPDPAAIKGHYGRPAPPGPDRSKGPTKMAGGASSGLSVHKAEGIWPVDDKCSSNIPGLFAAGDGLGSMMLGTIYTVGGGSSAGSAVQGGLAAESACAYAKMANTTKIPRETLDHLKATIFEPLNHKEGYSPAWLTQMLQNIVIPTSTLYIKSGKRLEAALINVEHLRDIFLPKLVAKTHHELRLVHETRNMILNAEMRLRTSLFRTESRGNHYREDFPARDDENWLAWIKIKNKNGQMELIKVPVPEEWRPDPKLSYEERYLYRFPGELEYLEQQA
jgi:succinate dehydrogenase/fumarate reductase flavoprotein subunit